MKFDILIQQMNQEMEVIIVNVGDFFMFPFIRGKLLDGIKLYNTPDIDTHQFLHAKAYFTPKNYKVDNVLGKYEITIDPLSTYSVAEKSSKITVKQLMKTGEFESIVLTALES